MSNRRKVGAAPGRDPNWLNRMAASLDGAQIPGGCDTCNAYQTMRPVDTGITQITVHHDNWCLTHGSDGQR